MVFGVGHKLLKEYPKGGYKRAFNQAFTGFPKDVGFNNGLSGKFHGYSISCPYSMSENRDSILP